MVLPDLHPGFLHARDAEHRRHWLTPTWTLAVEEHFYLLVPALIVFTPPRWLTPVLVAAAAAALCLRMAVYGFGFANEMAALALLPGQMDILACGLLAAVAMQAGTVRWEPLIPALRVAPVAVLVADLALSSTSPRLFGVLSPLLVATGCTAFLLCIVLRAPEARRFQGRGSPSSSATTATASTSPTCRSWASCTA